MSDSHARSVVKGITWRILGSIDTFLISWLVTGTPVMAASITAVELITKITLYWAHERAWLGVKWGVCESRPDNQTSLSQADQKTTS
jgi:uncharacterized membrane protein